MKTRNIVIAVLLGILVISAIGFTSVQTVLASPPSRFTICHVTIDENGLPVRETTLIKNFGQVVGVRGHFTAVDGIGNLGHELDYFGECSAKYAPIYK